MSCVRCDGLGDADLALARALGPMLHTAASVYLSRTRITPTYEESPHGLTHAEQKLFSVLFQASPEPASYELIFYSMDQVYQRMGTLRTAVSVLRRKVGSEYTIKHIAGVGYRLTWENRC